MNLTKVLTEEEKKLNTDIQAYKTALGIVSDRDPQLRNMLADKLDKTNIALNKVKECQKNAGIELDFVQAAIARRDKEKK